ncbi:MAG: response regulator [Lachnospiraceae bacterium]|nr:response regulator [Lachnospiraceae bacterium]
MEKKTILIVDDVEINRAVLVEIFKDEYDILEAAGGEEALAIMNQNEEISAVLLDLLMPGIDGLGVLKNMNVTGRIRTVPVFLITASESRELLLEAYHLGAVDIISKPFYGHFIKHRIKNIIDLYSYQNELESIVAEQVTRLEKVNRSVIATLAALVEFRDCESGEHVRRMSTLTWLLMQEVSERYPEYHLPAAEIDKIGMSAVLHDVGKISIPDQILNKPGPLTAEEFAIMKGHTIKGCEILQKIPELLDEGTYIYSYDICRHHHERWDGRGYPDGLAGDEVSIWSQVAAVADVYDALTSDRVYKKAYSHEVAMQMIFNGECGAFNPKVLEAFRQSEDRILELYQEKQEEG